MKRALTQSQASELWRAASALPAASRTAFLAAVNERLASICRPLTNDDISGAIVATLADATTITTSAHFMCD